MNVIEPCCYDKQLTAIIERIEGATNVAHFYSFSDWTISTLLPYFAARTPGCDVTVCMVRVDEHTLAMIANLMKSTYTDTETKNKKALVDRLTLIINSPSMEEKEMIYNILGGCDERLVVCEDRIGFRAIMMSNEKRSFVVQGSINQEKSEYTQMFTLTTGNELYDEAMQLIHSKRKVKTIKNWKEKYKEIINRSWSAMNV